MNRETYEVGEEVKVHLNAGVFRGKVLNKKEVAMEVDDLHYATTMLYLVQLKDTGSVFALEHFMGKVSK